jgi:hypothetical protein
MRKSLFLIFIITVVLLSCKKDRDEVIPNVGYSYAGLEVGKYVIYNVDSHHYNVPFNIDTTVQFQIKEVIDSKYIDLEGEEAYKVIRYRKTSDSTQWFVQDVWNAKITATSYQKSEENIRYIKLTFPVKDNKTWNGNTMNNLGSLDYEYTAVHQSATIGNIKFDSVTTVLQFDDVNLVQERFFQEKFAAGVGLVYKKSVDIDNAYDNGIGLWVRNTGDDITMTAIAYGN